MHGRRPGWSDTARRNRPPGRRWCRSASRAVMRCIARVLRVSSRGARSAVTWWRTPASHGVLLRSARVGRGRASGRRSAADHPAVTRRVPFTYCPAEPSVLALHTPLVVAHLPLLVLSAVFGEAVARALYLESSNILAETSHALSVPPSAPFKFLEARPNFGWTRHVGKMCHVFRKSWKSWKIRKSRKGRKRRTGRCSFSSVGCAVVTDHCITQPQPPAR